MKQKCFALISCAGALLLVLVPASYAADAPGDVAASPPPEAAVTPADATVTAPADSSAAPVENQGSSVTDMQSGTTATPSSEARMASDPCTEKSAANTDCEK